MNRINLIFPILAVTFCFSCTQSATNNNSLLPTATPSQSNIQSNNPPVSSEPGLLSPTSVTASKSTDNPKESPTMATDGNLTTAWNSGGSSPQWIQLDLGQPSHISKIRLTTSQTPDGHTVHEIYGGATPDNLSLIEKLDGNTKNKQTLEVTKSVDNIHYIKIITKVSPSWVGWYEIQVYK